MANWTKKIPSILWIPIILGAIAAFIGGGWLLFYGIGFVEGFSSLALLVAGWFGFRIANNTDELETGGLAVALGLCFFALMGMALDQTGNFLYNKPIEWLFCPADSEIAREAITRGTRGGGTSVSQFFGCVNSTGEVVRQITGWEHLAVRFGEYLVLGYILLGLSRIVGNLKRRYKGETSKISEDNI